MKNIGVVGVNSGIEALGVILGTYQTGRSVSSVVAGIAGVLEEGRSNWDVASFGLETSMQGLPWSLLRSLQGHVSGNSGGTARRKTSSG